MRFNPNSTQINVPETTRATGGEGGRESTTSLAPRGSANSLGTTATTTTSTTRATIDENETSTLPPPPRSNSVPLPTGSPPPWRSLAPSQSSPSASGSNYSAATTTTTTTSATKRKAKIETATTNALTAARRDAETSTTPSTSCSAVVTSSSITSTTPREKPPTRLELRSMLGDGNCLFRSVSYQVYGGEDWHDRVREEVLDFMAKDASHFRQFVTGDFQKYVERKRRTGTHGDHAEIQAMAELYNRPVIVLKYDGENSAASTTTTSTTMAAATTTVEEEETQEAWPLRENTSRNPTPDSQTASHEEPKKNNNKSILDEILMVTVEAPGSSSSSTTTTTSTTRPLRVPMRRVNIFHTPFESASPPIRLCYRGRNHYDAIIDPDLPTVGVGLGLAGLEPGKADKDLMERARAEADREATEGEIERAVMEASLMDFSMGFGGTTSSSSCCSSSSSSSSASAMTFKRLKSNPYPSARAIFSSSCSSSSSSSSCSGGPGTDAPSSTYDITLPPAHERRVRTGENDPDALFSPVVRELVLNGFPLESVLVARAAVGEDYDEMLAVLLSAASAEEKTEEKRKRGRIEEEGRDGGKGAM